MLSRIEIENYRSFLDVKVDLAPFTLLIGAKGAIAVPVQMLESWILISLNPTCAQDLPIFSEKKQSSAKNYYNGSPPNQLKDLCDQARYKREVINKAEFFLDIADTMELNAVTAASPSFAQFRNQVASW